MYIIIQYFVFQICKMSVFSTVQKASLFLIVNQLYCVLPLPNSAILEAVFQIRDIDADPDPWIRTFDQRIQMRIRLQILLLSSVTFNMPTKNNFFSLSFYAYLCLKVHLRHSSKIKSPKEVTK
jgi:hypothetical protein